MSMRSGTRPMPCLVKPPAGATISSRSFASRRMAATSSGEPGATTAAGATPSISTSALGGATFASPTMAANSRSTEFAAATGFKKGELLLLAALASPLQQPSLLERRFRGQFSIAAVTGAVWRELDLYASRENGAIVILSAKREVEALGRR